jgi:hypothetical protein
MDEPSRRSSRLFLAAAVGIAIGAGAVGFFVGKASRQATVRPEPPPGHTPPQPRVVTPEIVPQPLGRSVLILAAAAAADRFSGGSATAGPAIAGQPFELHLPFGCRGPSAPGSTARRRWRIDPRSQALRVHVERDRWEPEEWAAQVQRGSDIEAIEGFSIERPWTSAETCPARPTTPAPADQPDGHAAAASEGNGLGAQSAATPAIAAIEVPSAPEGTLGIAQIHTVGESRISRRGERPFEAVERLAGEAFDGSQGLSIRLRGRIAPASASPPILCHAGRSAFQRPVCLIVAQFDEIAIENPATGKIIATWDVSSQGRSSEPAPEARER